MLGKRTLCRAERHADVLQRNLHACITSSGTWHNGTSSTKVLQALHLQLSKPPRVLYLEPQVIWLSVRARHFDELIRATYGGYVLRNEGHQPHGQLLHWAWLVAPDVLEQVLRHGGRRMVEAQRVGVVG